MNIIKWIKGLRRNLPTEYILVDGDQYSRKMLGLLRWYNDKPNVKVEFYQGRENEHTPKQIKKLPNIKTVSLPNPLGTKENVDKAIAIRAQQLIDQNKTKITVISNDNGFVTTFECLLLVNPDKDIKFTLIKTIKETQKKVFQNAVEKVCSVYFCK
jgi:hypothetical protein